MRTPRLKRLHLCLACRANFAKSGNILCIECYDIDLKARMREYRQKPETKARIRKYMKKYYQKPEIKAKKRAYMKRYRRLKSQATKHEEG